MTTDVLNTWKEIAAYLKISVSYAKKLARKYSDFPVMKDERIFTTRKALSEWVERKSSNPSSNTSSNPSSNS